MFVIHKETYTSILVHSFSSKYNNLLVMLSSFFGFSKIIPHWLLRETTVQYYLKRALHRYLIEKTLPVLGLQLFSVRYIKLYFESFKTKLLTFGVSLLLSLVPYDYYSLLINGTRIKCVCYSFVLNCYYLLNRFIIPWVKALSCLVK